VWENVYNPDTQTDDWYDAGSKLNVDVLKTVVKHTNTTLVIKVTFAELKKQQVTFSTVDRLRFDQGPKLIAAIDTNTKWGGTEVLSHLPSGQPVKCPGMTHSIDYTTNKVQMSIPRSCLGNPGWVQVNSLARGTEDAQGVIHSYVDNAEQVGHADVTWSSKIHKG
jgi:hypothetical protein